MSTQIYQCEDYKVYKAGGGFIVHNTHKQFKEGHTHVQSYEICMILIKLLVHKKLPNSRSRYFIESLIRLCDDREYENNLRSIMNELRPSA